MSTTYEMKGWGDILSVKRGEIVFTCKKCGKENRYPSTELESLSIQEQENLKCKECYELHG